MPVNHTDHADRGREDLVVDTVREPPQQHPPQVAADDGMALRPFLDESDGVVDRV
jgi:hypothetical protein